MQLDDIWDDEKFREEMDAAQRYDYEMMAELREEELKNDDK